MVFSDQVSEAPADDGGWFDGEAVGACTVQRLPGSGDDPTAPRWIMWYAGRPADFPKDIMPIATGFVGLAVSADGLIWEKILCLAPN